MKILFWLNGSGGQRTERRVIDYPQISPENLGNNSHIIEDDLYCWKDDINCHSQYIRWGWDDKFDEATKEPLSKT